MGNQIANSGAKLPFSANALDITNDIINANAKLNPKAIRYPFPCLDFLEEITTPSISDDPQQIIKQYFLVNSIDFMEEASAKSMVYQISFTTKEHFKNERTKISKGYQESDSRTCIHYQWWFSSYVLWRYDCSD